MLSVHSAATAARDETTVTRSLRTRPNLADSSPRAICTRRRRRWQRARAHGIADYLARQPRARGAALARVATPRSARLGRSSSRSAPPYGWTTKIGRDCRRRFRSGDGEADLRVEHVPRRLHRGRTWRLRLGSAGRRRVRVHHRAHAVRGHVPLRAAHVRDDGRLGPTPPWPPTRI
jgi:hypothetical protein